MGPMIDEKYIGIFLDLLRYVPYLEEEKEKTQIFISGLHVSFKDKIEIDEPRSLDEAIKHLKHCYYQ